MTVIRPNSISGITSITAQNSALNFYDSAGSKLTVDANIKASSIGVGTDSPYDSKLQVFGKQRVSASAKNLTTDFFVLSSNDNSSTRNELIFRQRASDNDWEIEAVEQNTAYHNVWIKNGNLKFTSGKGIDFSATADGGGTTTSELFDDYEEGLWTPQVTQGVSGTPTYEYQLGWYTKIGRIVTLYFYIKFASTGNTGSNTHIHVGNFPFPIVSTNNGTLQRGMGVSNYHSIPGFTSANVSFYGAGNSNTFASVYQGNQGVATSSAVNSQYIIGGIEYISE